MYVQTVCTRPLLGEEGPGNEARNYLNLISVNILFSCRNGHLEVVKMLIEDHHCKENGKDIFGDTPLHYACR